MIDRKYLAGFGAFEGINTNIFNKLIGYFPNLESAWAASKNEYLSAGISEKIAQKLCIHTNNFDLDRHYNELQKLNIKVICILDNDYPPLLKEISCPPFLLYIKGEITPEDQSAISVVGSRKATDYGRRATQEIAESLSKSGITIVSGLALGLDTEAHKAALKVGGRTIAVLANGLDRIYPTTNTIIANEIIKNGAIISEQPIGMPPLRHNFPSRNRIISGLSQGILIAEGSDKSGTLHTANFALEQNRQIYALPGPIYNPSSYGPNMLIKAGAKAVTCAQDILEDFGIEEIKEILKPDNQHEELIFEILKDNEKHLDQIINDSQKPPEEISRIVSLMEIKGKLRHLGGMIYTIK